MDADAREVSVGKKEVALTMREFNILYGMLSSSDKIIRTA